jgi:DNA processing protein
MQREELAGWLRLALTPGIGNAAARRLLAAFGFPEAVFTQSSAALRPFLGEAQIKALLAERDSLTAQLEATWSWLAADDAGSRRRVLTLGDPEYPEDLLHIEDPPPMLYAAGVAPANWPAALAVVGRRNPTAQGLLNAHQFARSFAQAGWGVVSGLALGIDGAAHEGALEGAATGQIATIAVVGTGLDRVYPRQHAELARRIEQQGLLVSEYPIGTPPLTENFPRRNRIIAALSRGTVVVEAALQSGSLITARLAAEQGKDVFAIPGSIHSTQSRGCHALLKQGAKLVKTAQDVLEEMRLPEPARRVSIPPAPDTADPGQRATEDPLLSALGFDPVSLDALVARTGTAPAWLQGRLLELELEGKVARLPGGLFQRVGAG